MGGWRFVLRKWHAGQRAGVGAEFPFIAGQGIIGGSLQETPHARRPPCYRHQALFLLAHARLARGRHCAVAADPGVLWPDWAAGLSMPEPSGITWRLGKYEQTSIRDGQATRVCHFLLFLTGFGGRAIPGGTDAVTGEGGLIM